jgi:hypothetical protein
MKTLKSPKIFVNLDNHLWEVGYMDENKIPPLQNGNQDQINK